jgi:hypothetical protein
VTQTLTPIAVSRAYFATAWSIRPDTLYRLALAADVIETTFSSAQPHACWLELLGYAQFARNSTFSKSAWARVNSFQRTTAQGPPCQPKCYSKTGVFEPYLK